MKLILYFKIVQLLLRDVKKILIKTNQKLKKHERIRNILKIFFVNFKLNNFTRLKNVKYLDVGYCWRL